MRMAVTVIDCVIKAEINIHVTFPPYLKASGGKVDLTYFDVAPILP